MPTDPHQAIAATTSLDRKRLLVSANRHFGYLGLDAEDLVQEAVALLLEGRRRWPPEIPLQQCLWMIVCSLASHWLERPDQQRTQSLEPRETGTDASIADTAPPLDASFEHDLARFRASLADDPRLQVLLDGLLAGYSQTEIARQLGVSNARVTGLKQVLSRRMQNFFA